MKRDSTLYLKDIMECIDRIEEFMGGMGYDQFVEDDKTASAVIRKVEVIGEAAKNVPAEQKDRYPEVPWADMARMRDKIIHSYFGVDHEIVWRVAKERLPKIRHMIEDILKEITRWNLKVQEHLYKIISFSSLPPLQLCHGKTFALTEYQSAKPSLSLQDEIDLPFYNLLPFELLP